MVPETVQKAFIHPRLEVGDVKTVVLLAVDTKVLDLVQGNCLILTGALVWGLVTLGVGSEGSQVDFPSGDGPYRVDNNGDKGILKILIQHLG